MFKWIHNEWSMTSRPERIRVLIALILMVISAIVCYNSWMNYREAKEEYGIIDVNELRREILRTEGAIDVETLEWFLSLNGLGIIGILVFMIVIGIVIGVGIASENQEDDTRWKNRQIRELFEEAVSSTYYIRPGDLERIKQRLEDILGG